MTEPVLEVRGLCKKYPSFALENVDFSLRKGRITGFIGRNGAGKSTTLKSILNFVHPDAGKITFFGMDFATREKEIREKIGFVAGGVQYYPQKSIRTISKITASFYPSWDENAYRRYMDLFSLDENKKPSQLSAGMQVKYAIVLALSHNAELLLLDEPTSGLDPVSREELLDVLLELCREGKTILFSTHITSDLDRCADDILYIRNGKICGNDTIENFLGNWQWLEYEEGSLTKEQEKCLVGKRPTKKGCSAIVRKEDAEKLFAEKTKETDLETVMVHLEREGER